MAISRAILIGVLFVSLFSEKLAQDYEDCRFPSPAPADKGDRETLTDLYQSWGGVAWLNNKGWSSGGDPCTEKWFGVCCNFYGRVTVLSLPSNRVLGQITSTIAQLDELKVLDLHNNTMEGILPVELFSMKNLVKMDLSTNMFTAGIPEKISLPRLLNMTLSNNRLQGFLPAVWDTPSLEYIYLSNNNFQGELSPGLRNLTHLLELDVSSNFLTGVSKELGFIRSLERIWLNSNRFQDTGIPEEWKFLVNLKEIKLDGIQGEFPIWIGLNWLELESMTITYGQISGPFPTTICGLVKIISIDLTGNVISGSIPQCFCKIESISVLKLSDNQLTGNIPDCYGKLSNLSYLAFDSNSLSGHLPRSIGDLTNLRSIDFSSNNLYGAIPTEYSKLDKDTAFNSFRISNNKINTIEDGLEPFFNIFLTSTRYCSLYGNPWSCPLPAYMTTACNVECSKCNTPDKHDSCRACVDDSQCGYCTEGGNCLPGSVSGPDRFSSYSCSNTSWIYGFQALCDS